MKTLLPALRKLMLDYPAILATVNGGSIKRIFPNVLPQGITLPSIVANQITETDDYHMQGPSGLAMARIQIDCWALVDDDAIALANNVHDCLSGFKGTVSYGTNSPIDQVVIRGIFVSTGRDDYDDIAKLFARRRDYLVWHAEF